MLVFFLKITFLRHALSKHNNNFIGDLVIIMGDMFIVLTLFLQVSIILLVCSTVYMKIFLVETISTAPKPYQHKPCSAMITGVFQDRWNSMKETVSVVASRLVYL